MTDELTVVTDIRKKELYSSQRERERYSTETVTFRTDEKFFLSKSAKRSERNKKRKRLRQSRG